MFYPAFFKGGNGIRVKKLKKIILFIFIILSLFFLSKFFYIIYEEKVKINTEIENSLLLAEKKLAMYLKTFKWKEIDEKEINYNTILKNYLPYRAKTVLKKDYIIYKFPYIGEKFSSSINNGIIISKESDKNNKKLEKILAEELITLSETEKLLKNKKIKNINIITVNNDYRMLFSREIFNKIKENYYNESLKYPIISGRDMKFYKKENGKFYSLEIKNYSFFLKNLLKTSEFKRYEYLFLISPSTRYIYHLKEELLKIDFFTEALIDEDKNLKKTAEKLYNEKPAKYFSRLKKNKVTSQSSIMGYKYFSQIPMYIGIISLDEESIIVKIEDIKRNLFLSIIFFSLFLGGYLIINLKNISSKKIALISVIQLLLLCVFIGTINYCSLKEEMKELEAINSSGESNNYLWNNNLSKDLTIKIQIESIEFKEANNVRMTGIIQHESEPQYDVFFPDAVEYSEWIVDEDKKVITKKFLLLLREEFNYYKYPLESNIISLKMQGRGMKEGKVIVPDFKQYPEGMLMSSNPGIRKGIVLNGWNVVGSFFSFNKVSPLEHELVFNIYLKRNMLSPFISNLLPFSIILSMAFGILILIEKEKKDEGVEFTLGSASGLFFTVILSQSSLRDNIATDELLYLDYYYFFLYIVLLFTVLITFFYKYQKIEYGYILNIKKLFWFSSSFIIMLMTLIIFNI
ncbi:hypothetical protein HMPREF0402_04107 [Fusobacterium ulcerans 12-1B]|uniref:Cache domain-containing protein n=2 Tax=Fusobacterium ulcerans TaxID=861 RepID=S2LQB7_9FUSO|nr:hypothetical protein HMPREF0402_04107 [Fusobacterium ulcerans 12-1B]